MNPIRKKEKRLTVEFYEQAMRFKNDLFAHARAQKKRESMYDDFLDMLLAAQKEEKAFAEVIPDYTTFFRSCIEGERLRPAPIRAIVKRRKPIVLSAAAICSAAIIVLICLLSTGSIAVWTKGMDYIQSSGKYTYTRLATTDEIEILFSPRMRQTSAYEVHTSGAAKITRLPDSGGFHSDMEGNICYMVWEINLKFTAIVERNIAQILCGKSFNPSTQEEPIQNATFTYELGGVTYTGTLKEDSRFNDKDSIVMYLAIGSHESAFSYDEDDTDKLNAMRESDTVKIKISGLILNQWVRQ